MIYESMNDQICAPKLQLDKVNSSDIEAPPCLDLELFILFFKNDFGMILTLTLLIRRFLMAISSLLHIEHIFLN